MKQIKNNNKGFTLIELLAVIVILGVIMLIAIPSVSDVINSSKKSTFLNNAKLIADAATKCVLTETTNGTPESDIEGICGTASGLKVAKYLGSYNTEYSYYYNINTTSGEVTLFESCEVSGLTSTAHGVDNCAKGKFFVKFDSESGNWTQDVGTKQS